MNKTMNKTKIDRAKTLAEQFLQKQGDDPNVEVSIEIWPETEKYGVRVAEVSFVKGNGGSSFMQCYVEGALPCFFAERLIIDYADDTFEDDVPDDEWRLCHSVYGRDPK